MHVSLRNTRARKFCCEILFWRTESLRLRWCAGDSTSTRQFAPVSSLCAVRESCFVKILLSLREHTPAARAAALPAGTRKKAIEEAKQRERKRGVYSS